MPGDCRCVFVQGQFNSVVGRKSAIAVDENVAGREEGAVFALVSGPRNPWSPMPRTAPRWDRS